MANRRPSWAMLIVRRLEQCLQTKRNVAGAGVRRALGSWNNSAGDKPDVVGEENGQGTDQATGTRVRTPIVDIFRGHGETEVWGPQRSGLGTAAGEFRLRQGIDAVGAGGGIKGNE